MTFVLTKGILERTIRMSRILPPFYIPRLSGYYAFEIFCLYDEYSSFADYDMVQL